MLGFEGTTWACLLQAWPALREMWVFSGAEAFSSHAFSWATQRHTLRITKKDYYLVFYHIGSHSYCGLHVIIFRENTYSEADTHKDHDLSCAVDSTEPCLSQSFEWLGHPRITFGSQYHLPLTWLSSTLRQKHPWSAFENESLYLTARRPPLCQSAFWTLENVLWWGLTGSAAACPVASVMGRVSLCTFLTFAPSTLI